ncbi:uncharacterized protein LW93_3450 [Fusarium fujikuroi]|nr:uncharacterized protein LW93_3450 [Fusarium fujikuroi]
MSSDHHHVQVFTDVPAHLFRLLEVRLPQSLTLLRRLQVTTFLTGKTDSARITVASDVPSQERSASSTIRHFTATYLDPFLGLETDMWLYSTSKGSRGAMPASPTLSPGEDALCRRGLRSGPIPTYEYDKFIFRIDKLPLPHELQPPSDMVWGSGTVRDCELAKARTRSRKLLLTLPSLFIKLKGATPVAWAFLASSARSPSAVEGLQRPSSELLCTKASAFSGDSFAAADVAPDNASSQAMCKSLNGRGHWAGSW